MYEKFYGFEERPFSLLPDPDFLFLGDKHQTALDLLELAVINQSGFCLLSGDIGAGKTTIVRELLNRLDRSIQVGLVSNTHESFGELMQWVMAAYGLECQGEDRLTLHKHFMDFLIRSYADNRRTLLIIDEAQNLSVAAMEELRMLSNVNSDKDMVLQVLLVGQQQLREKLQQPKLVQFAQRIGVDFHLTALSEDETRQYILHRIARAGGSAELFNAAACQVVYHASMGVPRLINRICDLGLVYGFSEKKTVISAEMLESVINDQQVSCILEAARNSAAMVPDRTSPRARADRVPEDVVPQPVASVVVPAGQLQETSPVAADVIENAEPETVTADVTERLATQSIGEQGSESDIETEDVATPASELHRLVVGAEQQLASTESKRGGSLRALAVVVIALGLAAGAWAGRDVWLSWQPENWINRLVAVFAPMPPETISISVPVVDSKSPAVSPKQTATMPGIVARELPPPVADPESEREPLVDFAKTLPLGEDSEAENVSAVQPEAENKLPAKAQPPRQETGRQAEIPPPVKETARQAEVRPPVRETARQAEARRLARLREEWELLEREQEAKKRKASGALKTHQVLEQDVPEEPRSKLQAREEVERITSQRERLELPARTVETQSDPVRKTSREQPLVGEDSAWQRQDSGVADVEEQQQAAVTSTAGSPTREEAARDESSGGAKKNNVNRSNSGSSFSSNPCEGPSARFMSTCF